MYIENNNFALLGFKKLLLEIQSDKDKRNVHFIFCMDLISACLCTTLTPGTVIIPIAYHNESMAECINIDEPICEIKKQIFSFLSTQKSSKCWFCSKMKSLTSKEIEVILLTSQKISTGQLSDYLKISKKTLYVHQLNIKDKLGFRSRARFINWCQTMASNVRVKQLQ